MSESEGSAIEGVEAASKDDVLRWRSEFSGTGILGPRPMVWIPQRHYHPESESYVWGIRPHDGCWVCDNQWPMVEEAMQRGEDLPCPLMVVVTKDLLDKVERRMRIFDGEFFFYDDELPQQDGKVLPSVSFDFNTRPTRDDIARWRKQFQRVMEFLRKKAYEERLTQELLEKKKGIPSKYDLSPDEVTEVPEGALQKNIFGGIDVVPFRKSKRR